MCLCDDKYLWMKLSDREREGMTNQSLSVDETMRNGKGEGESVCGWLVSLYQQMSHRDTGRDGGKECVWMASQSTSVDESQGHGEDGRKKCVGQLVGLYQQMNHSDRGKDGEKVCVDGQSVCIRR